MDTGPEGRECQSCGQVLALDQFPWCRGKKYRSRTCKSCDNKRRRDRLADDPGAAQRRRDTMGRWRDNNREKIATYSRRSNLLRRYGLTVDQYDEMARRAGGMCPICLTAPEYRGKPWPLVVDHDHRTGKIRGLLCWRCNGAMGIIGEGNLHRLLEYLAAAEDS